MTKINSNKMIQQAFDFLKQFSNYERALRYPYNGWAMNLERVRVLLSAVGSPEKKLKVIHIAGTKGKGSTCKMVQAILTSAGFKVGLYTSPHLLTVNERISINERKISNLALAKTIQALRPGVNLVREKPELGELTYFEMLTASAFYYFFQQKVDFAVLETGLGGRYDATNICQPVLAIITPISFDHTDILGDTLAKIALEKAMIIKPAIPVILSPQPEEAREVFLKHAQKVGASLLEVENYYQWQLRKIKEGEMVFDLIGKRKLRRLKTKMIGLRQMSNCASAILAMDVLEKEGGKRISDEAIYRGLEKAHLAGRFQTVNYQGRKIVLDGAHNQESARALRDTLELVYQGKSFILLAGLSQDKDIEGFFSELKSGSKKIIISQASIQRAAPRERMEKALRDFKGEIFFEPDLKKAMGRILKMSRKDDLVVITGSFYLVGEAIEWLKTQGIKIRIP